MSVTAVNPDDISTNTDVPTKTNGPEYVAFGLVPVFFLLGLLGVLICHALKKKGYRCTTEAEDAEAEAAAEADKELEKDAERGEQSRAEQSRAAATVAPGVWEVPLSKKRGVQSSWECTTLYSLVTVSFAH